MDLDDGTGDEEPLPPLLPPDDRLWRHPSELAAEAGATAAPARRGRFAAAATAVGATESRVWTIALLSGVIGALLATSLSAAAGFRDRTVTVRPVQQLVQAPPAGTVRTGTSVGGAGDGLALGGGVVDIAERIRPAIVQVQVDVGAGAGSGSGVMFRSDGFLITNEHVVSGARNVTVVMADGREKKARVVGADDETDVAVLKVDVTDAPVAPLGSARALKVGQPAIAIGSPLGLQGGPSVSVGVVSALGRQVEGRDGPPLLDMIQTDAPIAPGSSGGALLDGAGAVIGITTAIAVSEVGAEGLGFATPIDIARHVADQLVETGRAVHVWLGIQGEDLPADTATELGIPGGALVRKVVEGSPAAAAGLAPRDVITQVGDTGVGSMAALVVSLRTRMPGDRVSLRVLRDGKPRMVDVTLSERPKNP